MCKLELNKLKSIISVEDFKKYVAVQVKGDYNMNSIQALFATGLDMSRYVLIRDNYSELDSIPEYHAAKQDIEDKIFYELLAES